VRRWSDRRKIVQTPLFPGYAFVHTSFLAHARRAAFYLWGVLGFVSARDQALPIPDSEIEGIRALLASNVALTPYPFLKVGQRVRVRGGSLDGIEGILLANGDKRLVISVAAIHQSLSINIEGYDVEPI
jgi:transcription antitermination factor NusG